MILTLRGKLLNKNGLLIIIDVNGIGYGVWVSMNGLSCLPEIGEEVLLYIHQIIREDANILYGFLQEKEKLLFCELIKISGLGGKLALAILSHLTVEQFVQIIMLKDLHKLIKIPGVGQKTAQRLMVEMQNNFENNKLKHLCSMPKQAVRDDNQVKINYNGNSNSNPNIDSINSNHHTAHDNTNEQIVPTNANNPLKEQFIINDEIINDVQEALIVLGYKPKEALHAVNSVIHMLNYDFSYHGNEQHEQHEHSIINNNVYDDNHNQSSLAVNLSNNKIIEYLLKKALNKLSKIY